MFLCILHTVFRTGLVLYFSICSIFRLVILVCIQISVGTIRMPTDEYHRKHGNNYVISVEQIQQILLSHRTGTDTTV